MTRRELIASVFAGAGLFASYGLLAGQGLLFLLPKKTKARTRLLYAGQIDQYKIGSVQKFYDIQGNEILVKRDENGFNAFSSTCPHLGCKVHWEEDKSRFLCPCHNGLFDLNGKAYAGPPADADQRLANVPVKVDEIGGVVYIEVPDVKPRRST